jgi:hypothetical protein
MFGSTNVSASSASVWKVSVIQTRADYITVGSYKAAQKPFLRPVSETINNDVELLPIL